MAAAKKSKALFVSAPLVQVQLGDKVLHLFEGDLVPDGYSDEWLKHHQELGYVTEGDAPAEPDEK